MADREDVTRFGTGYQQTLVERLPDGRVRWNRTLGVNNTDGFRVPPPQLAETLEFIAIPGVEFLLPEQASPTQVVWMTDGTTSFSEIVRKRPDSVEAREGVQLLASMLVAFHEAQSGRPPTAGLTEAPPGLMRYRNWLATGEGPRASSPWRVHLRSWLGTRRWELLEEAGDALLLDDRHRHLGLHGWMSLGNVVLADNPHPSDAASIRLQVLTGTDMGRGLPETDLTCLMGEIAEFTYLAERDGIDPLPHRHLAHILTSMYSFEVNPRLVEMGKAVRVALHARDFASFVGWHDDLDSYPPLIAELVDQISSR